MHQIDLFLSQLNDWVWSPALLFLLLGTGIYLTFLLKGVQFKYLGFAFKQIFAKQKEGSKGDISHFEALMTSLAGAIGTGTIVGVATAVMTGGLGALFWMWVTAFISMATKYAESLLAVKYREVDQRGEMSGGPMQYIRNGLGWNKVAILFAIIGMVAALTTGNLVQANSIAGAVYHVWGFDPLMTGIILFVVTTVVILGGVKYIGHVAGVLVPLMALLYVGAALFILVVNIEKLPYVFGLILDHAWNGQAAFGGFTGAGIMAAIQMGVARSVFSNEAGLGISAYAAGAARTDCPCRQALISMTGALLSTVVVCTMTGLVLAVTGVIGTFDESGNALNGASLAIAAFNSHISGGDYIVTIGLIFFAYTTIIAWSYYGEKCCEYLFGERSILIYRFIFALCIIPGAFLKLNTAWYLADISNGLMVIPNLIALIALSKVSLTETETFIKKLPLEK